MLVKRLPLFWRRSLKLFASLLLIYTLLRLLFLVNNYKMFQAIEWQKLAWAFLHGLRFDLVAIVYSNLPVFLLFFAPPKVQEYQWFARLKRILFVLTNVVFLGFNFADIEYYQLSGKRMGVEVIYFARDIKEQLFQMAMYYWYLALVCVVVVYILYKLFPRYKKEPMGPWWCRVVGGFLLLATFALVSRGGMQKKPLHLINAFRAPEEELGALTLNTTFTLIRSSRITKLGTHNYFANEEEISKIIPVAVNWENAPTHENLVLILLESFSLEYVGAVNGGQGYTPFFDGLITRVESRFFRNGFSNGRRSIGALPSLLSGIPSWLPVPFAFSNLAGNKVEGLGHVLKWSGYSTAFFHGAENGSFHIDSYSQREGWDKYYGLNDYPNSGDYDGKWGIYDEPFLQFTVEQIFKMKQPFAAVVFTLSSHSPYDIPIKYADKFPKGTLDIHESIGYTDYSLRQFFAKAEKQPWYKNTLFVITADHTSLSDRKSYEDELGRHRVPILFFHPGRQLPKVDLSQPVQHVDIPLTIMHSLGLRPERWTRLGRSAFTSDPAWVMNRSEVFFWYLDGENFLKWDGRNGFLQVYSHQDTKQLQLLSNESEEQKKLKSRRLHAALQYFFNGMRDNRLLIEIPQEPSQ